MPFKHVLIKFYQLKDKLKLKFVQGQAPKRDPEQIAAIEKRRKLTLKPKPVKTEVSGRKRKYLLQYCNCLLLSFSYVN